MEVEKALDIFINMYMKEYGKDTVVGGGKEDIWTEKEREEITTKAQYWHVNHMKRSLFFFFNNNNDEAPGTRHIFVLLITIS